MRRRRYRKPRIKNVGGYWIAQYRDLDGTKRKVSLGPVRVVRKGEAEEKLAKILEPINTQQECAAEIEFGQFVRQVYFPFYRRKWKRSTIETNEDRFKQHLLPEFERRKLDTFRKSREELQDFLDAKAATGLSYSTVAHLRWDLRHVFRLAVQDEYLERNPAEELYIPSGAPRAEKTRMTADQVRLFLSVLDLRERVIGGLGILAGMRPGEIFALKRSKLEEDFANIQQRIYRGELDTPKTFKSRRLAALGDGLIAWLGQWLELLPDSSPDAWLFPSETGKTPVAKDNCWRRHFQPRLKAVGLGWVNFQVMRRSHASLLSDLGVDPQVRADQMGHGVDVNQNEYTRASLERRKEAVNTLEKSLGIM
jgi:integrase